VPLIYIIEEIMAMSGQKEKHTQDVQILSVQYNYKLCLDNTVAYKQLYNNITIVKIKRNAKLKAEKTFI
jgi:hypothetical protein